MPGYWIRLHDRPPETGASGRAEPRVGAEIAERLGCRWCWWAADRVAAWEATLRVLEVDPRREVTHVVGTPPWLDSALDRVGCRRIEADTDPHSGAPLWPATTDAVMLDHRHAMPTLPPAAARLILEDATTAMGGSVHGQLVGSLGHATVVIVGPPMWPRSSGAIVATARENVAERLRGEPSLAPLDSVTDAGLRADLASVADRVEAFQAAAAVYDSAWRDKGIDLYAVEPPRGTTSSRSEYVIGVPDPDGLAAALAEEGIEARRPLNERLHRVLSDPSEAFPGARTFYTRALQLPNHPGLDLGELLFVADLVVRHLRAARA